MGQAAAGPLFRGEGGGSSVSEVSEVLESQNGVRI